VKVAALASAAKVASRRKMTDDMELEVAAMDAVVKRCCSFLLLREISAMKRMRVGKCVVVGMGLDLLAFGYIEWWPTNGIRLEL
jgi:hypothetical protein